MASGRGRGPGSCCAGRPRLETFDTRVQKPWTSPTVLQPLASGVLAAAGGAVANKTSSARKETTRLDVGMGHPLGRKRQKAAQCHHAADVHQRGEGRGKAETDGSGRQ